MSTINQEDLTAGAGLIVNGLQMDLIIFLQIVESLWEAELVCPHFVIRIFDSKISKDCEYRISSSFLCSKQDI